MRIEVTTSITTKAVYLQHDESKHGGTGIRAYRGDTSACLLQVPTVQPAKAIANPAMGVRRMRMSPSGRFLATVNDAQRCALWLWDLQDLALACLLQHQQPVAAFEWDPRHDKLAVCTSGRRYSPFGCFERTTSFSWYPLPRELVAFCSRWKSANPTRLLGRLCVYALV